jgi:tripartite-type tricarboxylate transporter receptor subunit TctC
MRKVVVALLVLALCPASFAQTPRWPSKPIRVLIGFAPGGSIDISVRLTADVVAKDLGQALVIEYRPGGAGSVAVETLVRGGHDGHTIVVGSDSSFYQPVVVPSLSYRAETDLRPITILTRQPIVIAVHPAPGWGSIADLLRSAKARPGEITYALSSATGSQAVAASMFFGMAGVKLTGVPYKGGGQAAVDLVSGQVPVAVLGTGPLLPHAKAGKITLLAVMSKTRARVLPDVPALAELGYPQVDMTQWFGAVAPANVPEDVVTRLSSAFNRALTDATVSQRLFDSGLEVVGGTPAEMARRMSIETSIWSKAAKQAGLAAR